MLGHEGKVSGEGTRRLSARCVPPAASSLAEEGETAALVLARTPQVGQQARRNSRSPPRHPPRRPSQSGPAYRTAVRLPRQAPHEAVRARQPGGVKDHRAKRVAHYTTDQVTLASPSCALGLSHGLPPRKRSRVEGDKSRATPKPASRCVALRVLADTSADVSAALFALTRTYAGVPDRSAPRTSAGPAYRRDRQEQNGGPVGTSPYRGHRRGL
jgi:hypothetical protein